jgi:hypothetical protein
MSCFFYQTASDRWATYTGKEGCCFVRSNVFSSEIHSAFCELKENDETQRNKRCVIYLDVILCPCFGIHDYTPLRLEVS